MKVTEFLEPTAIVGDLVGSTPQEVLTEICRPLAATAGVDTERLVEALLEREKLAPTAIGDGLAIPHGKVPGLQGLVAGFGRSRTGIDFKAPDSRPAALLFALLAPDNGHGLHLKAPGQGEPTLQDSRVPGVAPEGEGRGGDLPAHAG